MIEAKNLVKYFGHKLAVDDISFTVEKGEVLGFLGPNAAGKSTTMRMLTGFISPSSGTSVIGGRDIVKEPFEARKMIGYLPENAPTYPDMTVTGFLEFISEIRGFSGKEKFARVEKVLERCFLSEVRFQTINTLSKGFKQRVCFAQSILHDPEYLIMDEPTDGLDPNQKHEVRAMIKEMALDKAIILSTHNLEEVEAICSRAIIIANGRIVADDTPSGLKTGSSLHGAICVTLMCGCDEAVFEEIRGLPGVGSVEIVENTKSEVTLRIFAEDGGGCGSQDLIRFFMKKEMPTEKIFIEEGRLDEVFRKVTTS